MIVDYVFPYSDELFNRLKTHYARINTSRSLNINRKGCLVIDVRRDRPWSFNESPGMYISSSDGTAIRGTTAYLILKGLDS